MANVNDKIEKLISIISEGRRGIFFTGAGLSTESGIPDFRGPRGVWKKYKPIQYQEFISSEAARRESWRRKFEDVYRFDGASPNRGHRAIESLVRKGKITAVITQNTDGLHQASGVPDDKIIELHGNNTYAVCLDCGYRHELLKIRKDFLTGDILPKCELCGGIVKTATVSFGQPMPRTPMLRAQEETNSCDFFISVGSSLQVYPASGFPREASRNGATLVIINREATPLDKLANLVLHMEIGPVLEQVTDAFAT